MQLVLDLDAAPLQRTREAASAQGTTVESLVREFLERIANQHLARELKTLWAASPGNSEGCAWRREDASDDYL
ncbi:MAG: hypothetical protein SFW67_04715 [Myxococcaceae bacterium]|nr:hypothetical protein [Myxococcaceae bacterium]